MEDLNAKEINVSSVEGWTKEEKYNLFLALKAYGSQDIEKICENVPTKSLQEIESAVNYYKQIALKHPVFDRKQKIEKPKYSRKPRVPLSCWAKLLADSLKFEDLRTETSTALRLIADLEDIPSPVCTGGVDFRHIYHQVANAMEGKALSLDLLTGAVLHKTIVETAFSSKAFINTSAYKYVLNKIDLGDKEVNLFPRPTENQELIVLRHLTAQKCYNPLGVPEDYLKPACPIVWGDLRSKDE